MSFIFKGFSSGCYRYRHGDVLMIGEKKVFCCGGSYGIVLGTGERVELVDFPEVDEFESLAYEVSESRDWKPGMVVKDAEHPGTLWLLEEEHGDDWFYATLVCSQDRRYDAYRYDIPHQYKGQFAIVKESDFWMLRVQLELAGGSFVNPFWENDNKTHSILYEKRKDAVEAITTLVHQLVETYAGNGRVMTDEVIELLENRGEEIKLIASKVARFGVSFEVGDGKAWIQLSKMEERKLAGGSVTEIAPIDQAFELGHLRYDFSTLKKLPDVKCGNCANCTCGK